MLRCGDKFYNRSTMGSLVYQQAHQFWCRRQKGTKNRFYFWREKLLLFSIFFSGPWKLLPIWCEFITSGLSIGRWGWHVKDLHFRLLCCRFNFRQRTFDRGWWSSRGHCCNHGKKKASFENSNSHRVVHFFLSSTQVVPVATWDTLC